MYISESDVLSQYELLSKAMQEVFNVKNEELEANSLYNELKQVRLQLAEVEKNFPQPTKKSSFADVNVFMQNPTVSMLGIM